MTVATLPRCVGEGLRPGSLLRGLWHVLRTLGVLVWRLLLGVRHSYWWFVACFLGWCAVIGCYGIDSRPSHLGMYAMPVAYLAPLVVGALWSVINPFSFDLRIAGPWRRWKWRRWVKKAWPDLARECGLSVQRTHIKKVARTIHRNGVTETIREPREVAFWAAPSLLKVWTKGDMVSLRVVPRMGQTFEDLAAAVPAITVAAGAHTSRSAQISVTQFEINLIMRDTLTTGQLARIQPREHITSIGMVPAGRTQDDRRWWLTITSRHTLVAGCSGSGKGSVLWSVVGNLAPAIPTGEVQMWGIDLKRGIELSMGKQLFSCMATTPEQAILVLKRLLAVIDQRAIAMAGIARDHTPTPGDPLHVLVIDELAVLTHYADPALVKEASRLLSEVLTQGRALGVSVVACVQDPRKEIVSMRGLFTQTIALRQITATETRMVLGDGMATAAPAHKIRVSQQGTGWIVDETGHVDRVRADYWPDKTIREVAILYPAPVHVELPTAQQAAELAIPPAAAPATEAAQDFPVDLAPRARKPRAPRKPRQPRSTTAVEQSMTADVMGDNAA